MNWMDDFIARCLVDVPEGKYRERTEKELRDHMEKLRQSCSEEEVLTRMGDPERLRREYKAAWQRTFQARAGRLGTIAGGCLLMGVLYIGTALFLSLLGFTSDAVYAEPHTLTGHNFPIQGSPWALAIFGSALFLVPFPLGALFLRFRFRRERHPAIWVTLGLLAAWVGEKAAIISLSALIYEMPLGLDLLRRISRGGDVTGPWFTPAYIALTFLGCLVLGWLFGWSAERRRELA